MIASAPTSDVPLPAIVGRIAAGRRASAVWRNEVGGLTFEIGTSDDRVFAKWQPRTPFADLEREAERLRWAREYTPVPRLLDHGADAEAQWLVTAALAGTNAVTPRWIADPATAVAAIGSGLRAMHDALPVEGCPFDWSVDARVDAIDARGVDDPSGWHDEHRELDVRDALARLASPPAIDKLVVCHGDACAPNTLLDDDGAWSGHVDLGMLGTADRWADLAVATWSTQWNYGDGWEGLLLDAYGIAPDPIRTAYYRLLWDLSP